MGTWWHIDGDLTQMGPKFFNIFDHLHSISFISIRILNWA